MTDSKIGKIIHYYDKIGVAVVEILGPISVGDQVKFSNSNEFTQIIDSMQIEHQQIKKAKKGQAVGLKVSQPVKKGDEVFKIT